MRLSNRSTLVAIFVLIISGCAGSNQYMKAAKESPESFTPSADQSTVVFMRPSGFGFAISSSVYDVIDSENKFIGIVPAKKKIVYKTTPGEHLFMVVGESADFMKAKLNPGKVYFATVIPRMGFMKARFSLQAVKGSELSTPSFQDDLKSCELLEPIQEAFEWASKNSSDIQSKKDSDLAKWNTKAESDRPFLGPEDGR